MLLACVAASSAAVEAADLFVGASVPPQQRKPVESIDHTPWNELLTRYVDDRGMVDYTALKASAADMKKLDAYLDTLSTASFSPQSDRNATLAFWINAYNAVTVKGILREYPTSSIRNHTAKFFGYNIWKNLKLTVEGKSYSLEHIEHEILRKMGEPRIHFAIVCASIGCPRLLNEAYVAPKLDEQLDRNTRNFFADPEKFKFDAGRKTISVSPILSWFATDFGKNKAAQMRRIAPYLPNLSARQLAESGAARVSYLGYDWGLNDQAKAGRR